MEIFRYRLFAFNPDRVLDIPSTRFYSSHSSDRAAEYGVTRYTVAPSAPVPEASTGGHSTISENEHQGFIPSPLTPRVPTP